MFIDLNEAIQIVLELARANIPRDHNDDPIIRQLADKYAAACDTLEDYAVNHLGDE